MNPLRLLAVPSFFVMLVAAAPAFADHPSVAPPPARTEAPVLRTDSPKAVTYAMPKQVNPQIKVTTWGAQTIHQERVVARRDPYQAEITGVNRGSQLHATVQQESDAVELPEGVQRIPMTSAADRKLVNRDFNKQLAANVGKAVKEQPLFDAEANVDSTKQTMTIDKPEVLAPNAPVTLHGRDVFNRPLTPARTTAEGLETTTAPATYNQGRWETTTTGGMVVAPYKPWAKMENVMSTPAYQAPDGKTYAKLLGLAAFPRNATVKVTNTRLRGEGAADHTVQIQKLSNAGAGAVEVPALQGDLMEVEVSYPAVPGKSQAASVKYTYTVPMASKGALREAKYRTNTGIAYLPVVPREREAAE